LQLGNALGVKVKADSRNDFAEFDYQGQADVALGRLWRLWFS